MRGKGGQPCAPPRGARLAGPTRRGAGRLSVSLKFWDSDLHTAPLACQSSFLVLQNLFCQWGKLLQAGECVCLMKRTLHLSILLLLLPFWLKKPSSRRFVFCLFVFPPPLPGVFRLFVNFMSVTGYSSAEKLGPGCDPEPVCLSRLSDCFGAGCFPWCVWSDCLVCPSSCLSLE